MMDLRESIECALDVLERGTFKGELIELRERAISALQAVLTNTVKDCGEAGHNEGRCGNASCLHTRQTEPVAWMHEFEGVATLNMTPPNYYGDDWKHTALYTAPPKREPLTELGKEPVAWMHEWLGVATLNTTPPKYYGDHWKHTPLYTTQHKLTPLTVEQADELVHKFARYELLRATERAHRIGYPE